MNRSEKKWQLARRGMTASGGVLRPWLTDPHSLTARLIRHFGPLQVVLLRQGLAVPHRDEAALIRQRPGALAWVREVILVAQGRPLVYARSILARRALRGDWHRLSRIGTRPLGAALFADPRVSREALRVRRLDARDARHARAVAVAGGPQPPVLWARRSRFVSGAHGLVVCEVFLAGMQECGQ